MGNEKVRTGNSEEVASGMTDLSISTHCSPFTTLRFTAISARFTDERYAVATARGNFMLSIKKISDAPVF